MSTAAIARPRKPVKELPWQLWASQLAAVLDLPAGVRAYGDVRHPRVDKSHGPQLQH
jgi:hypothetical protein